MGICAEYPSFYKVMSREGQKLKMDKMRAAESKDGGSSRFERMHRPDDKDADCSIDAKSESKLDAK